VFTDDEAVELHRTAIAEAEARGLRVALVVIDAVTSPTGIALPLRALARLAREHGATSFVDAAHGPGHQDVSPASTRADFWAGTFHKWAFSPRGAAAFWVTESMRDQVEPVTTSWNRDQVFPGNFDFRGTDDYSGWMSLGAAVGFWRDIGGFDAVQKRSAFLDEMAALVRQAASPEAVELPARPAPCLRLVPLPDGVASSVESADGLYVELSRRKIECQVVAWGGRGFIRLSAAPYNRADDYEILAQALPTCQDLARP
jgi:isopenicillin-N epimerase